MVGEPGQASWSSGVGLPPNTGGHDFLGPGRDASRRTGRDCRPWHCACAVPSSQLRNATPTQPYTQSAPHPFRGGPADRRRPVARGVPAPSGPCAACSTRDSTCSPERRNSGNRGCHWGSVPPSPTVTRHSVGSRSSAARSCTAPWKTPAADCNATAGRCSPPGAELYQSAASQATERIADGIDAMVKTTRKRNLVPIANGTLMARGGCEDHEDPLTLIR